MSTGQYGGSRTTTISRQLMRQRQGFTLWTLVLVLRYSSPPNAKQLNAIACIWRREAAHAG